MIQKVNILQRQVLINLIKLIVVIQVKEALTEINNKYQIVNNQHKEARLNMDNNNININNHN